MQPETDQINATLGRAASAQSWSDMSELSYENMDRLLPFEGLRNPVHRSGWAKTGALVGRTAEDEGLPRPVGYESALERAVAIFALLHPNTFGLKCQPRTVVFSEPVEDVKSNTLDFLVTLRTGQKIYLFVKNDASLRRPQTQRICEEIRMNLPDGYGFAVISEASFSIAMRGNFERMFLAKRTVDDEADQRLRHALCTALAGREAFTVEELVFHSATGGRAKERGRAFDAVLRAIADHRVTADLKRPIDYPSVLRLAV